MSANAPEAFGPYLVYERLGSGGMAHVHRAIKTGIEGFQRPVALKRLLSQYAGDQEFVRGFVREARLASRLQHPNIAATYDLGRVDHTYYIAMELVDGIDLRHVLRHIAYSVGPMPAPLVLSLGVQICDALDYAHSFKDETGRPLGIVHRDVSPSNVIVGRDGVVKIIDFGIAKASSATLFTASGTLKGKFSYMAPESLEGHTDARSDLFAVGVVLYELLTARPLFKGGTDFDTLEMVKRMTPPPPSSISAQIPSEVDQVVGTALAKNPTQRWQNAAGLRNALAALAAMPGLRATHLDVPRWIEWALTQPVQPQAWDEAPQASNDDPSMVISLEQGTQVGVAPVPQQPRAPVATEASRRSTLLVPGSAPVVGGGIPGLVALRAEPAPTMMAPSPHDHLASQATYVMPQPPPAGTPGAANPLANPEYLAAAAAFNASEERRKRMEAAVSLPGEALPPVTPLKKSSPMWIFVVLLLCAGAAVGGFFLVDALM